MEKQFENIKRLLEENQDLSNVLFCLLVAARVFYEAVYRSVSDFVTADAAIMLEKVSAVNEAQRYYMVS